MTAGREFNGHSQVKKTSCYGEKKQKQVKMLVMESKRRAAKGGERAEQKTALQLTSQRGAGAANAAESAWQRTCATAKDPPFAEGAKDGAPAKAAELR